MKKILVVLFALALVLYACEIPTSNGNGTNPESEPEPNSPLPPDSPPAGIPTLKAVKTTGIRSLYTSTVKVSGSAWRAAVDPGTEIATLSYTNQAGENTPVIFTASDDRDVILGVTKTKAVGDAWIITDFSALYTVDASERIARSGRTLVNMKTGTLYDFSGYGMDDVFIDGGTVYARNADVTYTGGTLYKIALGSDMHAVPLNNVTYDPAGTIKFKLGNAIVAGDKVFSINGSYAPHVPGVLTWTDGRDGTGYWPDFSNRDFITDDNGNVWTYSFGAYYENNNAYGTFAATQIVINSDGTMQLADSWSTGDPPAGLTHEAKAKITISASEYIYYNSMGYCIVKKDSSGNGVYFSYGVFSSPVNNLSPYSEKAVFISDYLYWLSGTSICRIRLADGASESAIYTDSKILSTVSNGSALSLSGDNLVFYAYADATTVNTYSIPVAGPYTPVLLSTSSAGVKDIVELEF